LQWMPVFPGSRGGKRREEGYRPGQRCVAANVDLSRYLSFHATRYEAK
jgi:hypothetical protein